jgi:hypothetical protein
MSLVQPALTGRGARETSVDGNEETGIGTVAKCDDSNLLAAMPWNIVGESWPTDSSERYPESIASQLPRFGF